MGIWISKITNCHTVEKYISLKSFYQIFICDKRTSGHNTSSPKLLENLRQQNNNLIQTPLRTPRARRLYVSRFPAIFLPKETWRLTQGMRLMLSWWKWKSSQKREKAALKYWKCSLKVEGHYKNYKVRSLFGRSYVPTSRNLFLYYWQDTLQQDYSPQITAVISLFNVISSYRRKRLVYNHYSVIFFISIFFITI